jgi:hypothetical protein
MKKANFKLTTLLRQVCRLPTLTSARGCGLPGRVVQKLSTFSVDNDVHSLLESHLSEAAATNFAFPLKT